MKQIKLSGREIAVLRAIEPAIGTHGGEISERTQIAPDELLDILNGLAEVGYVEAFAPGKEIPYADAVPGGELATTRFEINPSYAQEIKQTMLRH